MKILVMSDSHGNSAILDDIRNSRRDITYFLHLGDSCLPEYMINKFCAVKGNCDFINLPRVKEITVGKLNIHLEHGDGYNINFNPANYIRSLNCDIFLYGHTHKKFATKIGNTYVFNPGSLTRPRDGDKGSYLILDINDDKLTGYEFVEIDL